MYCTLSTFEDKTWKSHNCVAGTYLIIFLVMMMSAMMVI